MNANPGANPNANPPTPQIVIETTETFDRWLIGLRDQQARRRVHVRIDRAEDGNFGDCAPVGEGVSEMRIHYGGYRVYFTQRGQRIVILLAGGDKSTQNQDIARAQSLARQLRQPPPQGAQHGNDQTKTLG